MSVLVEFQQPPGKPVLRGFDHFWSVIRMLDERGPWSIHDVLLRTNRTQRSTVADYVNRLVAGGVAAATGKTIRHRSLDVPLYALASSPLRAPCIRRDGEAGLQGRGQLQMWNVMRGPVGRGGFTFRDLALYASTDIVAVKLESAKAYIKRLSEAGYLVCLTEGRPCHPALWKLKPSMNTGSLPPVILRTHVVYDQNIREAIGASVGEEVPA